MKTEETTTTEAPKPGSAAAKKTRAAKTAAKPATKKASKSATPKKPKVKAESKSAGKKAPRPAPGNEEARAGTKKSIVLDLLRRKQGATMPEIAKATDWQNHSIRGFISGNVSKKMGLTVESSKNDAGVRTYRLAK